jgi:hypothetical protein
MIDAERSNSWNQKYKSLQGKLDSSSGEKVERRVACTSCMYTCTSPRHVPHCIKKWRKWKNVSNLHCHTVHVDYKREVSLAILRDLNGIDVTRSAK